MLVFVDVQIVCLANTFRRQNTSNDLLGHQIPGFRGSEGFGAPPAEVLDIGWSYQSIRCLLFKEFDPLWPVNRQGY